MTDEVLDEVCPESVSQNHPGCRLSSGLFRTNGCPLNREDDCDLCGVEAFEKWYCSQMKTNEGGSLLCPPEGCPLGGCVRENAAGK